MTEITNSLILLSEKFKEIKKEGYIESTRKGFTGVGKTFEDLIGKKEDRSDSPDFNGIEIKTKLGYKKSFVTLFNATP